jgi:hypothetical protein
MKLLANRAKVMSQLRMEFLHVVRDENLAKDPTPTDLASIQEIRVREEISSMVLFGCILHSYVCVFSLLQQTQTFFSI